MGKPCRRVPALLAGLGAVVSVSAALPPGRAAGEPPRGKPDPKAAPADARSEFQKVMSDTLSPDARARRRSAVALSRPGIAPTGDDRNRALEALAAGLTDPDRDVRLLSAAALGAWREGTAPAVPALAKAARDGDTELRLAAFAALRSVSGGASGAVPTARAALADRDPAVRRAAAKTLPSLTDDGAAMEPAVPALIEALGDPDHGDLPEVIDALTRIGPRAAPAAVALAGLMAIPDHRPAVSATLNRLLTALRVAAKRSGGGPDPATGLDAPSARKRLDAVADRLTAVLLLPGDPGAAAFAADPLKEIGAESPRTLAALRAGWDRADSASRRGAVDVLSAIGPRAEGMLARAMADEDAGVRLEAAAAIWGVGTNDRAKAPAKPGKAVFPEQAGPAVAAMIAIMNDETVEEDLRREAAAALGRIGPAAGEPAAAALARRLVDPSAAVVEAAGKSLLAMGPASGAAVTVLRELARSGPAPGAIKAVELFEGPLSARPEAADAVADAFGHADAEVRAAAVRAIARRPQAEGHLARALADTDVRVRVEAAAAVWGIGTGDRAGRSPPPGKAAFPGQAGAAVDALVAAMADAPDAFRREAAAALGRIGPSAADKAGAALAERLDDGDDAVADAAARSLRTMGNAAEPAVPVLRRMAKSGRPAAALKALGLFEGPFSARPEAADAVADALRHPDRGVRLASVQMAGRLIAARPSLASDLARLLASPDESSETRLGAAAGLARLGPLGSGPLGTGASAMPAAEADRLRGEAATALAAALKASAPGGTAPDDKLAAAALESLAHIGGPRMAEAAPLLMRMLTGTSAIAQSKAAELLALPTASAAAAAAVPTLTAMLSDRQTSTRQQGAALLGGVGPAAAPAVPKLAELLGDDSLAVTDSAKRSLASLSRAGVKEAADALIAGLSHKQPDIRAAAASAVPLMGPPGATPAVSAALKTLSTDDPDPGVRSAAVRVLRDLAKAK
jgi:HEAT repeat protein